MKKRDSINYIFFGFFFLLLLILTVHHLFLIDQLSTTSRLFFLSYSVAQLSLEILLLMALGGIIRTHFKSSSYSLFIGFSFIWLMSHVIDFISVRLVNISVWNALKTFIINEPLENLIEMIYLTDTPFILWVLMIPLVILIPILGIALYKLSNRLSKRARVFMRTKTFFPFLIALPLCMLLWDMTHMGLISSVDYQRFEKALPWKKTFISPKKERILFQKELNKPPREEEQLAKLSAWEPQVDNLPNIYLIISEAIRDDYVTARTAPHLWAFKKENLSFDLSLANANATHPSWFAIFFAKYPHYWKEMRDRGWKSGSLPLQMLKKMGYEINLISAAQLKYYGMDELIFGAGYPLVDRMTLFPHYPPKQAWESDKQTVEKLISDLDDPAMQRGQVFLIFWDSTHFNYSWPPDYDPPFTPYARNVNLLYACTSKYDLMRIKNRYRNSIHYVDSLFGKIVETLKEKGLYEEAIAVFTGDHGEEFFEHGHFFHASQTSVEQLSTAIFCKFPRYKKKSLYMGSHLNIFPTILEEVTGESDFSDFFDGTPLSMEQKFVFSARNAWGQTPTEFRLHNGQTSLHGRFMDGNTVEILDIRDLAGESLHFGSRSEQKEAATLTFEPLLRSFFTSH